jgi:spore germination protein GerM
MTRLGAAVVAFVVAVLGLFAWYLSVGLPQRYSPPAPPASAAPAPSRPAEPGRKIKARLFYVSEDGSRLTGVERDVPYADSPAAQAQAIVAAQLAPVSAPLVSAVPAGTALRGVFVTERGEAYVDLSAEVATRHPGGTLGEVLTVYTLVHALTTNLPAIRSVQVLVDGREVETLAGHVDLRRPLAGNLSWVE